jgi:hypothetical protein
MEAVTTRAAALARTEVARAAVLAGLAAVAVTLLAPPGGDAAAHAYRTELVREGVRLWDNLWYGGHYLLVSYSPLYYLPTAAVGNVPLVVAATVASAALFAAIVVDEWGEAAARWPARAFALLAALPLFSGTYSYALGVTAGLAALRLVQLRRPWTAVAAAGLGLGFSPLAFAFLLLALAAALAARPRLDRPALVVAGGLGAIVLIQLVLLVVFPSEGRYPFSVPSLAGALAAGGLGAALAFPVERARVPAFFLAFWTAANVAAFLVASPFGDNLTRARAAVFPLVLLAAVLARFRPRALAAAALAASLYFVAGPTLHAVPKRVEDARTAEAAFWAPALDFLSARATPDHRVSVVPTFGHWEAYFVPRAGFALARGWYRQIDIAEHPELYRNPLTPEAYRRWLRRLGVRYVLLPEARLGPMGARREAELLRSGRAGLVPVFRRADWTIYELPGATPILTGPAPARLDVLGHDRVAGRVDAPGRYRLRVRHTPYWRVAAGAVCLERAPDGMTVLVAAEPGRFALAPKPAAAVARSAVSAPAGACR